MTIRENQPADGESPKAAKHAETIRFLRKKELKFVAELGQGACGTTLLLLDETIDQKFVCKKYSPLMNAWRQELFGNFVREIKILHLLHHPNIVRLFNYYLYPENFAGYILMEYVDGKDIESHILSNPDQFDSIFAQVVDGFSHLERNGILHRDIRTQNLLVSSTGEVKIIDFGFGKQVAKSMDFGKSITLNWWCPPPKEFDRETYNFTTEVYFVGKLFERIMRRVGAIESRYSDLISQMCSFEPEPRPQGFLKTTQKLTTEVQNAPFSSAELSIYRQFADAVLASLSKIDQGTKYIDDPREIERRLSDVYSGVMLESHTPNCLGVLNCLIDGGFRYFKRHRLEVELLRQFIELLRKSSVDRKTIIVRNLATRLDTVERYTPKRDPFLDDDIPF